MESWLQATRSYPQKDCLRVNSILEKKTLWPYFIVGWVWLHFKQIMIGLGDQLDVQSEDNFITILF